MINRRKLLGSIGAAALAWPETARTQPARKMTRIGVVVIGGTNDDMTGPLPRNRNVRLFLRGMAELGYVYGRDFVTEPRGIESLTTVSELVDLKCDVIVATGGGATLTLLKQATSIALTGQLRNWPIWIGHYLPTAYGYVRFFTLL